MNGNDLVLLERDGAVAILTINRPEKRNALSAAVRASLLKSLEAIAGDRDIRVVIVTGAGDRAFIAGADIAEFAERTPVEQHAVMRAPSVHEALERLPQPVIAAVNGYCLGGGLELAMSCDLRIACSGALFGQPEINLGLIPGGGGTQRLPRLIGLGAAMQMILTGEPVDAEEARRLGLVQEVVAHERLLPRALELAHAIARKSPIAVAAAKEAARASLHTPLSEGVRVERGLYLVAFASEDKREGVGAFLEKRPAHFTGR